MSVILRRTHVDWVPGEGPLFMLIGPVRGAPDWQYDCYRLLEARLGEDFSAYIPRRYGPDDPLYQLQRSGTRDAFERQTDAERYYINRAGLRHSRGCVLGWLPLENSENPRPKEEGPYAQDTYGEIGEIRGHLMYARQGFRFVLGADRNFPGLDVMRRNFDQALNTNFPIYRSLEETVDAAMNVALTQIH